MSYILTEKLTSTVAMYMVLKRILTKWTDWKAYKHGIIDEDGKRLRKPRNSKERDGWDILDRFCWSIKRLVTKYIGDKQFVYLFSAAYLMKEDFTTIVKQDIHKYDDELVGFTATQQKQLYDILQEMAQNKLINENSLDMETNIIKIFKKTSAILEKFNLNEMAFHHGDLGVGWDTTRKHMSGSRGTGHFGTGTYFLSKPSKGYGRADRPVHNIDLSKFKMYKPDDPRKLHDAMRTINRLAGSDAPLVGDTFMNVTMRTDVDTAAFTIWINYPSRQSQDEIAAVIRDEVQKARYHVEEDTRTVATKVMQRLGYDGIDVLGSDLDNTDYGTVVFVKPDGTTPEFTYMQEALRTILHARPTTNSLGQPIADTPEAIEEFWDWFGDSKCLDDQGRPLVVFHGSTSKVRFNQFDKSIPHRPRTQPEGGIFFTTNGMDAYNYKKGGHIVSVYLKMLNPLNTTKLIKKYQKQGMTFGEAKREALVDVGQYDSVIFDGDKINSDEYVVFDNSQIKTTSNKSFSVGGIITEDGEVAGTALGDIAQFTPAINTVRRFNPKLIKKRSTHIQRRKYKKELAQESK